MRANYIECAFIVSSVNTLHILFNNNNNIKNNNNDNNNSINKFIEYLIKILNIRKL